MTIAEAQLAQAEGLKVGPIIVTEGLSVIADDPSDESHLWERAMCPPSIS